MKKKKIVDIPSGIMSLEEYAKHVEDFTSRKSQEERIRQVLEDVITLVEDSKNREIKITNIISVAQVDTKMSQFVLETLGKELIDLGYLGIEMRLSEDYKDLEIVWEKKI